MRPPSTYTDPRAFVDYFHDDESPEFRAQLIAGLSKARGLRERGTYSSIVVDACRDDNDRWFHVGRANGRQIWPKE